MAHLLYLGEDFAASLTHRVNVYDGVTGAFIEQLHESTTGVSGANRAIRSICLAPNGNIVFVGGTDDAATAEIRVWIYQPDGTPVNDFNIPYDNGFGGHPRVHCDENNDIFVSGPGNIADNLYKYSPAGSLIDSWLIDDGLNAGLTAVGDFFLLGGVYHFVSGNPDDNLVRRVTLNTSGSEVYETSITLPALASGMRYVRMRLNYDSVTDFALASNDSTDQVRLMRLTGLTTATEISVTDFSGLHHDGMQFDDANVNFLYSHTAGVDKYIEATLSLLFTAGTGVFGWCFALVSDSDLPDLPAFTDGSAFEDGTVSYPLTWLELTDRADVLKTFAEVDLNDPEDYYGGYKAPWVLRFLPITRGLSDRTGQLEHLSFGALLSDTHRFFRGLLASSSTKYLTNRPLVERMIDDEQRRIQGLPRIVAVGYVSDYSPKADLQFEITGTDWLKKKFSRKREAQQSWQPVIREEDFSSIPGKGVKEELIGTPVPLLYGNLKEEITGIALTTPTGLVGVVVGAAGSHTYTYGVTALTPGLRKSRAEHWGETDAAFVTVTNAPALNQMSATRYVALTWDAQVLAETYRVYGRKSGGTLDLNFLEDTEGEALYDDGGGDNAGDVADEETNSHPPPQNNSLVASEGHGVVPVIWVGRRLVPGVPTTNKKRYEFLVCAHAVNAITGVYVDGVKQTAAQIADHFLIPGTAEYIAAIGSATYRDFNGRRYTLVYCRQSALGGRLKDGESVLTLDVEGIEDVGDGTGDLIRSPVLQRLHFMNNYVAPDTPYTSGAYLTAADTLFMHIPNLSLVDEASHLAVQAAMETRIPGGYETAGMIGAKGTFVSAIDALAMFQVSGDFDQVFNRKGQDSVSIEPITLSAGTQITDMLSIVGGSFDVRDDVQQAFFNILPFVHSPNYTDRELEDHVGKPGWFVAGEVRSQISIDLYDQERASPLTELYLGWGFTIQGLATIADVMGRKLARYRDPQRTAAFSLPFSGLAHEPGDVVQLTHFEGIGADGWVDRRIRLTRHEVAPTEGRVRLEGYDLDALFSQYGEFAPEDTPDWEDASSEERARYMFFTPETGSTYTDGEAVKVFA